MAILILSSNLIIIRNAYNLYQQRGFFESHKDYCYYQLNYKIENHLGKSDNDDVFMNQVFYQKFQHHSLQYVDLTGNFDSHYPVLLSNRAAIKEIKSIYPSIEKAIENATEEKVYLLLPSNLASSSQEYDIAMEIGNAFFSQAGYGNIETIRYDTHIYVLGIHRLKNYQTKLCKNPILLFNNTIFQINESLTGYDGYYAYDTMYDIPIKDWQAFIHEFQLTDQIISKSNVLDVYEYSWSEAFRNMKLTLILSAFLLTLEMALLIFVIRLDYQFNSVELALKKVHGYSLFRRNKKIFSVTFFSSLVGILAALILIKGLRLNGGYSSILVGLILLALELFFIVIKAKKTEKSKVTSVLKGEKI